MVKKPGGFLLPIGYHGLRHEYLPFRVAYCDLAKKLHANTVIHPNTLENITSRWISSITTSLSSIESSFSVETLAVELGKHYDIASSTYEEGINSKCSLDDDQEEIMRLLSKMYLLNAEVIFQSFGTSLRLLVQYGKLNIQPYSNGYFPDLSELFVSGC